MFKRPVIGALVAVTLFGLVPRPAAAQRNPGVSNVCGEFAVLVINAGIFGALVISAPDEGWAYVDPARKTREATGIARNVHVAATDTPANHYSHDLDFEVELDPNQDDLLSIQADEAMPIEWESGVRPWEKTGDGAQPIFPKWAWPSEGDRLWVEGNWIFDCGHPQEDTGLYKTEIHPARAIASMRERAAPLPGTGLTPVPVTATDLYITGNGGFAPNQLNCGPDIILGPYGSTCGQDPPPADTSYKTTPINDRDFTFFMCLPPRPAANAVFSKVVEIGPGNTVAIEPRTETVDAGGYCLDPAYDQIKMLQVTVPLKDTATPPESVYARRIFAGWVVPPDPVLPHRVVTINSTDLHEDHDLDPGDGELTFWWMNVDLAQGGWLRLSDFANGNMDDYDDDFGPGNGEMSYSNASVDFYLRHGQSFTLNSQGFEQDCFDNMFDGFWFTHRRLEFAMYAACYADFSDAGAGDPLDGARATFSADDLGPMTIHDNDEYDIRVTIDELPPAGEDTSYLSIQTACTPAGEVALVGQPLTCGTQVNNAGTGLPRQVQIRNQFSGTPLATINSATWTITGPLGNGTHACTVGSDVLCEPYSVPVALRTPVNVSTVATPSAPGVLTERAEVTTASTDPDLTNNAATTTIEVFRSITVDVSPGNTTNEINLGRGGSVTVAILTTTDFDAATIDPLSVCFGDAGTPAERSCTEVHGAGHLEDVNKDRRPDLVLHFDVAASGIDAGDTSACVIARTRDGIGLYGCDAIVTR